MKITSAFCTILHLAQIFLIYPVSVSRLRLFLFPLVHTIGAGGMKTVARRILVPGFDPEIVPELIIWGNDRSEFEKIRNPYPCLRPFCEWNRCSWFPHSFCNKQIRMGIFLSSHIKNASCHSTRARSQNQIYCALHPNQSIIYGFQGSEWPFLTA